MGLFNFFKDKKNKNQDLVITNNKDNVEEKYVSSFNNENNGLVVCFENLPLLNFDNKNLIEIKEKNILAKINNLIPTVGNLKANIGNTIQKCKQNNPEMLYKVVLQKGGKLVDSETIEGAKRGFTMVNGKIKENANLVPINANKSAVLANTTAATMNVASMVVGQYYMQQVDEKLSDINDNIQKVSDFLDVEYKSKVVSLMETVFNITKFQISNLENDELRNQELNNILQIKKDCQELLTQAELHLEDNISKECVDYKYYEKTMVEIDKWKQYQSLLIQLLYQINILDFSLHMGIKSKEQCFGSFSLHTDKEKIFHIKLVEWHNNQCKLLKIDLDKSRRMNTGILSLIKVPLSWVNDNLNYKTINSKTISRIKGQTEKFTDKSYSGDDLFVKDVQIIIKNDKYYYLPEINN